MPGKIYLSASAKVTSNSGYSCYSGYCTGIKCTCHSNTEQLETAMTRFILQFLSACFIYFASYFLVQQCTAVYSSVVVPIYANIIQYPNVICVCRFLRTRSNRLLASGASGASGAGARDHGGSSGTNNSQHFAEVHHLESVESVYRLSPISCGLLTLYRFLGFLRFCQGQMSKCQG